MTSPKEIAIEQIRVIALPFTDFMSWEFQLLLNVHGDFGPPLYYFLRDESWATDSWISDLKAAGYVEILKTLGKRTIYQPTSRLNSNVFQLDLFDSEEGQRNWIKKASNRLVTHYREEIISLRSAIKLQSATQTTRLLYDRANAHYDFYHARANT